MWKSSPPFPLQIVSWNAESWNPINRPCVTTHSRLKVLKKQHIMLWFKEVQEQVRNKVIDVCLVRLTNAPLRFETLENHSERYYSRLEKTWKVVNLPKSEWPIKHTDDWWWSCDGLDKLCCLRIWMTSHNKWNYKFCCCMILNRPSMPRPLPMWLNFSLLKKKCLRGRNSSC